MINTTAEMESITPENMKAAQAVITGFAVWRGIGGKEMLHKVVGPTLDFAGIEIRNFTERQVKNLRRVIEAARGKIEPGTVGEVPPRVLNGIINEGIYCEDQLAAEYLGGVLASSRVSSLRDDRASAWVNVLGRLTTYQIRAHYLIYMALRASVATGSTGMADVRKGQVTLLLQRDQFIRSLDIHPEDDVNDMIFHIDHGLRREDLIEGFVVTETRKDEIRINPTITGISLLIWANGLGKQPVDDAFLKGNIPEIPDIIVNAGRLVKKPQGDNMTWL